MIHTVDALVIAGYVVSTSLKNYATELSVDGSRLRIKTNEGQVIAMMRSLQQDHAQGLPFVLRTDGNWNTARGTLSLADRKRNIDAAGGIDAELILTCDRNSSVQLA